MTFSTLLFSEGTAIREIENSAVSIIVDLMMDKKTVENFGQTAGFFRCGVEFQIVPNVARRDVHRQHVFSSEMAKGALRPPSETRGMRTQNGPKLGFARAFESVLWRVPKPKTQRHRGHRGRGRTTSLYSLYSLCSLWFKNFQKWLRELHGQKIRFR